VGLNGLILHCQDTPSKWFLHTIYDKYSTVSLQLSKKRRLEGQDQATDSKSYRRRFQSTLRRSTLVYFSKDTIDLHQFLSRRKTRSTSSSSYKQASATNSTASSTESATKCTASLPLGPLPPVNLRRLERLLVIISKWSLVLVRVRGVGVLYVKYCNATGQNGSNDTIARHQLLWSTSSLGYKQVSAINSTASSTESAAKRKEI